MELVNKLMAGVRCATPELHATMLGIATSMQQTQDAWIAELRAQGVKAAHPDDGWVDRKNNRVQFAYPQFNDGAKVGDLIALGWPQWGESERTRIVRIVGEHHYMFGGKRFEFEAAQGASNE